VTKSLEGLLDSTPFLTNIRIYRPLPQLYCFLQVTGNFSLLSSKLRLNLFLFLPYITFMHWYPDIEKDKCEEDKEKFEEVQSKQARVKSNHELKSMKSMKSMKTMKIMKIMRHEAWGMSSIHVVEQYHLNTGQNSSSLKSITQRGGNMAESSNDGTDATTLYTNILVFTTRWIPSRNDRTNPMEKKPSIHYRPPVSWYTGENREHTLWHVGRTWHRRENQNLWTNKNGESL